ncbi:uncharacterized protein SCHCODRAFT_02685419 [Schizophyllum commune H4-8]|uniref:uncharacterized protein n=1 Tax=Schizophyllum commune (strain H4-8 / FGSC 9210) TaxID=578458 RepID=UPI002160087F|nr:uncharacterized protein SCHCODRAFT_02685419 [Schizophyllum commune H4-8]KAI5896445.1 hypothetical protein SCHCODRAFT_02685419 [Schizophyllum commune H4-8]
MYVESLILSERRITKSKLGFPAVLDGMPKLRVLHSPAIYPRYGFGWIVNKTALMRHSEEATGQPCRDYLAYGLRLLMEAGFERGTYDFMHICPHGKVATLWYIATNESPEKRDLASNKEYVERAKAALGQTEQGKWYHIDLF